MVRVIGQFIGNRQKHLFTALSKLRAFSSVNDTSYLYDTKPMYECNQNRFLNAVCKVETSLSPVDLLRECKRIEKEMAEEAALEAKWAAEDAAAAKEEN